MTIKLYSERALELLNLVPLDSVWAEGNRPIYDRLPAISEGYKKSFEFGQHGKVMEGCEPLFDSDTGSIIIKRGSISWYEGSTALPSYSIQVPEQSGRWVIVGEIVKNVEGETLESILFEWTSVLGYDINYLSTGYVKNPAQFAFMDNERVWLPSESGVSDWEYLGLEFPHQATLTGVRAYGEGDAMMCLDSEEMSVRNLGGSWEINFEDRVPRDTLKLHFHSGSSSVRYVTLSGSINFPRKNWSGGIGEYTAGMSLYELSALSDESKRICPFCSFEVDRKGSVKNFRDTRVFTHEGNEPVSMWITEPFDQSLQALFEDVKEYGDKWLNTKTAAYHLYEREILNVNVR